MGELRQRVRGQRRDHVQVGAGQMGIEVVPRLAPGEREERLSAHEPVGPLGHERNDLVAAADEQPDELTRLVGGDAAGHPTRTRATATLCPRTFGRDKTVGPEAGFARREAS